MIIAFMLLLIGLAFIFIEFYLPGGIMAAVGAITLVASIVLFAIDTASFAATLIYVIFLVTAVGLLIKYTLRYIPKAKSSYSIYLSTDQEGFLASTYDASAIGKTGIVVTDLKPGGFISIDGKKHAAISLSGYLPQGTAVKVIKGEEDSLIVTSLT